SLMYGRNSINAAPITTAAAAAQASTTRGRLGRAAAQQPLAIPTTSGMGTDHRIRQDMLDVTKAAISADNNGLRGMAKTVSIQHARSRCVAAGIGMRADAKTARMSTNATDEVRVMRTNQPGS